MGQANMNQPATIFVSIASYRDPELLPTLRDMLRHAAYPENLHIAICWQDDKTSDFFESAGFVQQQRRIFNGQEIVTFLFNKARIDIIMVHYFISQGASWARSLAEALFENEQYFLQIDSHCRFIPDWDNEMITMLRMLQAQSPHPVISSYPPAYTPGNNEAGCKKSDVSRLIFREYDRQGIPMLSSTPFKASAPIRGSYLAGGFIFASGHFIKSVPNDPQIFFAGEEIGMAVRAFTHGYDVYHPHKPLLWHFYQREEHSKVWSDHSDEAKNQGNIDKTWWERDLTAKRRIRILLGLEAEPASTLAPYMLGKKRGLREFEYQAGICLHRVTALPEVLGDDKINYFAQSPANEMEWLERQYAWFSQTITLNVTDYIVDEHEISPVCLSVYNAQNRLLYKRMLQIDELETLRHKSTNGDILLNIQFKTASIITRPTIIRICPWSDISGWGKVLEKSW
ncbi:UDP-N-acetylglucosamine-transferase [Pantoea agglomerans]|uniref:UDP-N-acetylglucosamine-transferase n=1 Tax=Enterobacter agglomerans TaxID=549 RepID=UPI0020178392|nr:UDP-N-acetylglucosamine-transferase [Pantoea agglomerans]